MSSSFANPLFWFLGLLIVALTVAVVLTWRIEVRVWMIPKTLIRQLAEDMRQQHGQGARREAAKNELDAFTKGDHFKAGKWSRVVAHLRAEEETALKAGGNPKR